MKICFVIFGEHNEKPIQAISEAIDFLKEYISLETKTIEIPENIEPSKWYNNCYFAHAGDFKNFLDQIPTGYDIYICLWRAKNKPVCWYGGTWGKEYGIHNSFLCSLPYDLPDCYTKVGNQYNYRLSQRIIHEILNALHGMKLITKSPEKCPEYGYSDPELGWKDCYIECLKTYGGEKVWKEVWSDSWELNVESGFQPKISVESYINKITKATEGKIDCGYINIKGLLEEKVKARATVYLNNEIATIDGKQLQSVFEVSKYKSHTFLVVFDATKGKCTVRVVVEQEVI